MAFGFLIAVPGLAQQPTPSRELVQSIPKGMMGEWAKDGKCTVPSERLVITESTATLGIGEPQTIAYNPEDGPGGNRRALHWSGAEGLVSNLEWSGPDAISLNGLGWGKGGPTAVYFRCPNGVEQGK